MMRTAKKIHVYSPKGGTGKSTLSVNLAAFYTEQGKRVCVIDCDEQQTVADLYAQTLELFDVRTQEPTPQEGHEILIYDHHPTHQSIKIDDGIVVCPIRPSRIDFESYRRGRAVIGSTPHILVVNQWTRNGGGDQQFIDKMRILCDTNNIQTTDIKMRNIYKRATNKAQSIFTLKPTLYGVSDARKDIKALAGMIDER